MKPPPPRASERASQEDNMNQATAKSENKNREAKLCINSGLASNRFPSLTLARPSFSGVSMLKIVKFAYCVPATRSLAEAGLAESKTGSAFEAAELRGRCVVVVGGGVHLESYESLAVCLRFALASTFLFF